MDPFGGAVDLFRVGRGNPYRVLPNFSLATHQMHRHFFTCTCIPMSAHYSSLMEGRVAWNGIPFVAKAGFIHSIRFGTCSSVCLTNKIIKHLALIAAKIGQTKGIIHEMADDGQRSFFFKESTKAFLVYVVH